MDCVFIEGLELRGKHGAFDFEREKGNDFLLDIRLYASLTAAAQADDLQQALDYNLAVEIARKVMEGPSVNLVEKLAEQIAGSLMVAFPAAQRVELKLSKLNPPMDVKARAGGVEISRTRD